MVEVEIRNFQSIEHQTVKIDGFTALVGRSNIGKSAVVRAVRAALTGAPVDGYVRHGPFCFRLLKGTKKCKCACSVHLRAEGVDLFWEKGDDVNRYIFNGQEYTAADRGQPEFLQDKFGFVKIGDNKQLIQVSDQFRRAGGGPIFLLDESGSTIADVLSDVANLDQINVAIRLAEKDRREAAAQRKVREKDVADLRARTEGFNGLDDALARAHQVEIDEQRVQDMKNRRDQLLRFRDDAHALARQVRALSAVSEIVVPDAGPILMKGASFDRLGGYVTNTVEKEAAMMALQGVEDIQAPSMEGVKTSYTGVNKLNAWVMKVRSFKDFFDSWKSIEGISAPDIDLVTKTTKRMLGLAAFRSKHANLETMIAKLEEASALLEVEAASINAEREEIGTVCPTCARPICDVDTHVAAE